VSAFVTPGSMHGDGDATVMLMCLIDVKFVLLHEARNDEGIRGFFMDVWELYVKVSVGGWVVRAGLTGDRRS